MVLDDAVVDDGDPSGAVRMGIALGRRAVGGPAGMADARGAVERPAIEDGGEVAQLALGAAAVDCLAIQGRDAGAVIAAIFETAEGFEDERRGGARAENANDAAHQRVSFSGGAGLIQVARMAVAPPSLTD